MESKNKYEVSVYLLCIKHNMSSIEVGLLMNKKGHLYVPQSVVKDNILTTITSLTHKNLLEVKDNQSDVFLQNNLLRIVDIYDVNMDMGIVYRLDFTYIIRKDSELKFFAPTSIMEMIENQQQNKEEKSFSSEHDINIIRMSLFNEHRTHPQGYPTSQW